MFCQTKGELYIISTSISRVLIKCTSMLELYARIVRVLLQASSLLPSPFSRLNGRSILRHDLEGTMTVPGQLKSHQVCI